MALAHDDQKMSLEAFFQWVENHPGIRYEYLDGTITLMTGGTARHALIGSNLNRILGNLLEGSPCLVYSSDAYVQVTETACVCPDLTISCDPRDRDDLEDAAPRREELPSPQCAGAPTRGLPRSDVRGWGSVEELRGVAEGCCLISFTHLLTEPLGATSAG